MKYKALMILTALSINSSSASILFKKTGTVPPSTTQVVDEFIIKPQYVVGARGTISDSVDITGNIANYRNPYDSYSGSSTYQGFCSSGTYRNVKGGSTMKLTLGAVRYSSYNIIPGSNQTEYRLVVNGNTIPHVGVTDLVTANPAHIEVCFRSTLGELEIANSYASIIASSQQTGQTTDENGGNPTNIQIETKVQFLHRTGSTPPALSVDPSVINLSTNNGSYMGKTTIHMRGGPGELVIMASHPVSINGGGEVSEYRQSISGWSTTDTLAGELLVRGEVPVGTTAVRLNLTRQYS